MSEPTLETERLRLRIFRAGDLDQYHRQIYGEPNVTRYLPVSQLLPIERTRKAIKRFRQQFADDGFG